jgi:hypothetical protein
LASAALRQTLQLLRWRTKEAEAAEEAAAADATSSAAVMSSTQWLGAVPVGQREAKGEGYGAVVPFNTNDGIPAW